MTNEVANELEAASLVLFFCILGIQNHVFVERHLSPFVGFGGSDELLVDQHISPFVGFGRLSSL